MYPLPIDDKSITVSLKVLNGILRTLKGQHVELIPDPLGVIITSGTMTCTLYNLDHPQEDEELQIASAAWNEAYVRQDQEPGGPLLPSPGYIRLVEWLREGERRKAERKAEEERARQIHELEQEIEWKIESLGRMTPHLRSQTIEKLANRIQLASDFLFGIQHGLVSAPKGSKAIEKLLQW